MPNKSKYTALFVLPSEEQIADFLKIKDQLKELISKKDGQQWLKSKVTCYDKFLAEDHEHTFDFAILVFPEQFTLDDIELQKDMYLFYSEVPVCQYIITQEMRNESEEVKKIGSFFQSNFKGRVVRLEPYFYSSNDIEEIYEGLSKCVDKYHEKYENDLKVAFSKFDKDGSGSIDKDELADLSKELGSELTEEQLQNALKDLDLNGDGVIDIDEFSRWYFSGMKPYSGLKRSLLSIGKSTVSIVEALKSEEVSKAIHQNLKITTHKLSFGLNDPEEAHYVDLSFHIVGPQYAKLLAESEVYKSLNAQQMLIEDNEAQVFAKLSISLEPGNLEKNKKLFAPFEEKLKEYFSNAGKFYPKFELTDTELSITNLGAINKRMHPPQIPVTLVEALKDVEQFINLHVSLGVDADQIMSGGEKTLIEHALKGFKLQFTLSHLKHLKKALMKVFGEQESNLSAVLQMGGPGFMFGSDTSIKLHYDDIEELQQHPLASTLLIEFHQLISQLTGNEQEYYENWKEHVDLSSISEENLKQLEQTYLKSKLENVRLWESAIGLIDGFSKTTTIEVSALLENLGVFEFKMQGKGFGKLLSHLLKVASLEKVKSDFELLKQNQDNQFI